MSETIVATAFSDSTRIQDAAQEMLIEILQRGGAITFATFGNSMKPLIPGGSTVQIQGCQAQQIKRGDVMLLDCGTMGKSKFLIHRVINVHREKEGVRFSTKGDSSPRDIKTFTAAECLGKVTRITSGDHEFRIDYWFWRPINVLITVLSSFQAVFMDGFFIFRKKRFTHQILPQRLALSAIKRLVRLGKWLSARKTMAMSVNHA